MNNLTARDLNALKFIRNGWPKAPRYRLKLERLGLVERRACFGGAGYDASAIRLRTTAAGERVLAGLAVRRMDGVI